MQASSVSRFGLALFLFSCSSIPPPEPEGPNSAGLCIELETRAPIGFFWSNADQVYFARLPPGVNDPRSVSLIPSNHVDGEYVYLLNAPPGEYVAVLCTRRQSGGPAAPPPQGGGVSVGLNVGATDYTTFFDEDMIRTTRTTVVPGSIAFMGAYEVDLSTDMSEADPTQLHFYRLVAPEAEDRSFLAKAFSGDYHYRGSVIEASHDADVEAEFLENAKSHLAETGWAKSFE